MNLGYLVTQHVSTMRLWDLDGVLSMKPGEELREQDVLLRSFDVSLSLKTKFFCFWIDYFIQDPWHCRSWCSLDDIQIVKWSTSFHNWGSFKLVVRDFLTGLACKANCCTPFASAGPLPVAPRIHRSTHSVSIPNNQWYNLWYNDIFILFRRLFITTCYLVFLCVQKRDTLQIEISNKTPVTDSVLIDFKWILFYILCPASITFLKYF